MKIIYAVCGEGMGHAVRALPIIDFLQQTHKLTVLAGDKAFPFLKKHCKNVQQIKGLRIVYKNNKASSIGSVIHNLFHLPEHVASVCRVIAVMKKTSPQIVISDFEHLSSWAAWFLKIPLVSFTNQFMLTKTKSQIPPGKKISSLKTKLVMKLLSPFVTEYLVTSFFTAPVLAKNVHVIGPVLRQEIMSARPTTRKHILVYQTSDSNTKLWELLPLLSQKFVIYGQGERTLGKNCVCKPFSDAEFLHDLINCKAVITNGGFSLISEAIFLKKPVFSIPVQGQFEQEFNAFHVQRCGFGMCVEEFNEKSWWDFMTEIKWFEKHLKNAEQLPHWKKSLTTLLKKIQIA